MHLFWFKIPESLLQRSVDNEYLRSIYCQLNNFKLEELLIIRQKENIEIFLVGMTPEHCKNKLVQIFTIQLDHLGEVDFEQLADQDALR